MASDLNVKLPKAAIYKYLTILSLFSMAAGSVVQQLTDIKTVHAVH